MIEPLFPPVQVIVDLHGDLIAEHGGAQGLRDLGVLEASVARAHQIMAYADSRVMIFDLAAAVCASIIRNHPFVDGNKRIGFLTLYIILGLNNLYIDVTDRDAEKMTFGLASGAIDEDGFRAWVADNSFQI